MMSTPVDGSSGQRLGGWAGILASILFVASALIIGEPPGADAAADELAAFLVDSRDVGLVSVLLMAFVLPLFAVFAGAIRENVSDKVGSGLAGAGVSGGLLSMVFTVLASATFFGVAWLDGAAETISADIAFAAWNAGNVLFGVAAPLAALFLGVVALAGFRGALAKWQSWAALVIAALLLLGTLVVVSSAMGLFSFVGSMLFGLWILVTSIRMLRGA